MIFHEYWRSGAAWRVRMALGLKGLTVTSVTHDLRTGEQRDAGYTALNPQGLVPAIEAAGGIITQSLAILEWLEETHPTPPLLPAEPMARAQVRSMCGLIACDIHPLQNLRVQQWLKAEGADVAAWNTRWIGDGLVALDTLVAAQGGGFCHGGTPTMADCLLLPQLYSARRFGVEVDGFKALLAVEARAMTVPAIAASHPERHPDAD
ncbi:maleylacetoacetate isomerase [Polymorphobacter multimanifer]|uniref:maleylacetoacetate isomerase n=1 Tax=Polymorphobacter multimanifer TaxID=1070431 RepID=UPI0016631B77|nr:maleylacetoacetate isomerase [Polymorphobacter multimanifer]GGI84620.1 maleylacetoacetate isomerase [Polymorphobacter multimanifer]